MCTCQAKIKIKRMKADYKSKVSYDKLLDIAFFKIFSEYFNILKQNVNIQKEHNITDVTFFRHKNFLEQIELQDYTGETNIRFKLNGEYFNFCFDKYRQNDEYYHALVIKSINALLVRGNTIYEKIFKFAVSISNLRGEYIEMPRGRFQWNVKELEPRGFNDIFLPNKLLEDLQLYKDVAITKNKLMRYLMVGEPGTGKTESTLVLANVLKAKGITILKTPVDSWLIEKIQLAEALAPTIIIFDDLDLSIGSRSSGGYSPKELQQFLDTMDGTDKIDKSVGIIATTNSAKLLDLAAQRPGRFEKILSFDLLTKRNIGNIILKSLRYNCEKPDIKLYYNKEVVKLFYKAKSSGAYIFNLINVLNLKVEMMGNKEITKEWIVNEITKEIEASNVLKTKDHLNDPKGALKGLGYGKNENGGGAEYEKDCDYEYGLIVDNEFCITDISVKCDEPVEWDESNECECLETSKEPCVHIIRQNSNDSRM